MKRSPWNSPSFLEWVWGGVSFVNCQANGHWCFRFYPPQCLFFLHLLVFFGWLCLKTTKHLWETECFLRVLSQLNDNSLLKAFFQRSIILLHTIIIPLYDCSIVTFSIWSLYIGYGKNKRAQKKKRIVALNYQPSTFLNKGF